MESQHKEIQKLLSEIQDLLRAEQEAEQTPSPDRQKILQEYEAKRQLLTERLNRYHQNLKKANLSSEKFVKTKEEILASLAFLSQKAWQGWHLTSVKLAPYVHRYGEAMQDFVAHRVVYPEDISQPTPEEMKSGVLLPSRYQWQVWRKLWHMFSGTLIFILYQVLETPKSSGLIVFALINIFLIGFDLMRLQWPDLNAHLIKEFSLLFRREEVSRLNAQTFYVISGFIVILFFSKPIALLSILYLAFGDPAASFVGIRWGKKQLTTKATWLGSLACWGVCFFMTLIYQGVYGPIIEHWVLFSFFAALGAATIEAVPISANDNLTIPLFSAIFMALLKVLL